ncbi:MAG TPA: helix-turn-helix domain-containing protein [Dysgonamonadaceae bacterium]|jgi:excisionase family DNA binding protein|nr:helix-turn-helix domain-containing protein [Tissierellia bacterium]HKM44293.1 helix-turn-helix domain-containing protein [Dysgonamonadaceae bacterium]
MSNSTTLEERIKQLESSLYQAKEILSFEEACAFLNFSKSYLYKLTSSCAIPHYKPSGKMVYFERKELENWLRQNPVKTREQIEMDANAYIMKNQHKKK